MNEVPPHLVTEAIINQLGSFKEKNMSKAQARKGQNFTSARTIASLKVYADPKDEWHQFRFIKDIKGRTYSSDGLTYVEHTFSDGCGFVDQ